jgi:hypothetical protein
VTVRSVFIQWSLLERERERPLRDLAERTAIDTIELSHVYLVWGPRDPQTDPAPLALPAEASFADLPIPTLEAREFERLRGLLELIRDRGFSVACNLSPLFVPAPGLPRLGCVDVTGAPVPGIHPRLPVYGCPANPEVVRFGEAMARAFVRSWRPLDAVGLNHLEYPLWPQAGLREVFACFCDACSALAAADGLDIERVRHQVRALFESLGGYNAVAGRQLSAASVLAFVIERPELARWLRLRQEAVSAYAERVVAALREASAEAGTEVQIGLEFQLPVLAPLVGTDFSRLAPLFDWMTPKFPDYLGGSVVPLIAAELAAGSGHDADLRRRLRELLELGAEPAGFAPSANPSEGLLYSGAFRPDTIVRQRCYIEGRVSEKPVYPYLWLYGGDLEGLRAKRMAAEQCGWDGFSLWCWDSDLTTEAIRAAEGII